MSVQMSREIPFHVLNEKHIAGRIRILDRRKDVKFCKTLCFPTVHVTQWSCCTSGPTLRRFFIRCYWPWYTKTNALGTEEGNYSRRNSYQCLHTPASFRRSMIEVDISCWNFQPLNAWTVHRSSAGNHHTSPDAAAASPGVEQECRVTERARPGKRARWQLCTRNEVRIDNFCLLCDSMEENVIVNYLDSYYMDSIRTGATVGYSFNIK